MGVEFGPRFWRRLFAYFYETSSSNRIQSRVILLQVRYVTLVPPCVLVLFAGALRMKQSTFETYNLGMQ